MVQRSGEHESGDAHRDTWSEASHLGHTVMAAWALALRSGFNWYEMGLKVWSASLDIAQRRAPAPPESSPGRVERRRSGMPWIPQLDSKVIPFRRADDPRDTEGSLLSMRFEMPAIFGADQCATVISMNTLLPLPAGEREGPPQSAEAATHTPEAPQADAAARRPEESRRAPAKARSSRSRRTAH